MIINKNIKLKIYKNLNNNGLLKKIAKLKNQEWNYGLNNQLKWLRSNIKRNDLHILLQKNKKLLGYVLLRSRSIINMNKIKGKYFFFDTIIIHKKFRNQKLSGVIINKANTIIKVKNKFSVLLCNKSKIKYYQKYNWKITKKIRILNYDSKKTIMVYNKKDLKNINISIDQ